MQNSQIIFWKWICLFILKKGKPFGSKEEIFLRYLAVEIHEKPLET